MPIAFHAPLCGASPNPCALLAAEIPPRDGAAHSMGSPTSSVARGMGAFAWLALSLVFAALAGLSPAAAAGTYYAIGQPVCETPNHPREAMCFAMRRILVDVGTPGALAFKLGAGAEAPGTIGPVGGLTPSDLATAYSLPTTGGAGQTVAIVDAYNDPNIEADLQVFDAQYGLAPCTKANGCLTVVGQTGSTTALPPNDQIGWSVEETLDVETVHSICQGCKILLVEASTQNLANLAAAENTAVSLGAGEVTNSWGFPETIATASDIAAFNHPGVVITASTGDDGYYDYDFLGSGSPAPYNQLNFPAALNTVVAVGGTSLYLEQSAMRQSETVWNDNGVKNYYETLLSELFFSVMPLGASGGGCSVKFAAATWQTSLSVWPGAGCGTKRLDADVAAVADYLTGIDIYDSYTCNSGCVSSPGWLTVGGTSLASPLIASAYALAGGAQGVPYPALTLYGHPGATYDVTIGGNGWCAGEGAAACGDPNTLGYGIVDCDYPGVGNTARVSDRGCDALFGFDGPTGVGTPKGLTAFTKTGPVAPLSGPTSIQQGVSGTWTATPSDPFPGGSVTQYTWAWGDGTTTTTTTPSAQHVYASGAAETISLTVQDNYGVTGVISSYGVTVTPGAARSARLD